MADISINELVERYRAIYRSINPIFSPAIGANINFPSEGFMHLVFKRGHRRPNSVILNRLPQVPLIVPVIMNCLDVSETRTRTETKKDGRQVDVTYYALEARVGQPRRHPPKVRVVIRKENGSPNYNFQSVMKYQ